MRRFRFGAALRSLDSRRAWVEQARKVEDLGYDVLLAPDHVAPGILPPFLPLLLAAEATTRLRVGTFVLNNDFHHPVLLAREAATLDLLSEGRLELGMGAGHMRSEYEEIGIPFGSGHERVERLEESVEIVTRLWAGEEVTFEGRHHRVRGHTLSPPPLQQPHPTLLIGGNGRRILSLAATRADIVGLSGLSADPDAGRVRVDGFTVEGCRQRIDWVRDAAPERFEQLELNALVQRTEVTPARRETAQRIADEWTGAGLQPEDILASPYILIGDEEQLVDKLTRLRDELGLSYFTVFGPALEAFSPVVARLAGT